MRFCLYAVSFVVIVPIITLIHELGHAIIGIIFTRKNVRIILGNGKRDRRVSIMKLEILFRGYRSILDFFFGEVDCGKIENKKKRSVNAIRRTSYNANFRCIKLSYSEKLQF